MKGFPKTLKTKEDYYNCLAMVAAGELLAADLLAKVESLERQRYIQCVIVSAAEEKKTVTVYYCDEAAPGIFQELSQGLPIPRQKRRQQEENRGMTGLC